jgi:hypothetical protein
MRTMFVVIAAAITIASSASGHHSNSIFNLDSVVVIQGTVSRFDWQNPHVYIYVETTNDGGEQLEWLIETDPTPILTRNGWTLESLAPGDSVTVRASPDRRAQRNHALLVSIATEDGVVLTPRSNGVETVSRASSLSGVWDAMRGFNSRRFNYGALTEKGAVAQAEYSESDNPVANCIPFPLPTIVAAPYLYEIEARDDTITIRSEFFNVERTIYMDGRGHPENGERSNQGHSIGRWEGNVLVVDSTHFEDNRAGDRAGIPSSAQKHVVERYALNEDGTQIAIDFIVENPEYLAEPLTGGIEWDYAPDLEMLRFSCDPESARRYTFQ